MKQRDFGDIIDELAILESKYDVEKWAIDNIHIWPLLKIEYGILLARNLMGEKRRTTKSLRYTFKIFISKIRRYIAVLIDYRNEVKLARADILFMSDGMNYANINSKWYNKLSDPIASIFLLKGYTSIRLDLSHNFCVRRYSPSKFIQNKIDNIIIWSLVRSKLSQPTFSNENWADFDLFLNDSYFTENLIIKPSKAAIRKRIYKIEKLKFFYIKILKKIQPKICFVVNYYADNQMAFILACKELSIPSVDIQHGIQGALHPSYSKWSKLPVKGYLQLPNYFWVWSQNEKNNLEQWCGSLHKIIIAGNLFSQIWKDSSSEFVRNLDEEFKKLIVSKEKKSVVFTLCVTEDSEILKIIWEAIKLTQKEYNWFIRVHPSMIRQINDIKKKIYKKGITLFEIEKSSIMPLHTILRNVDAHITGTSSCAIEAAEHGLKSVICSKIGADMHKNIIASNEAVSAISVEEIINHLKQVVNQKRSLTNDFEYYEKMKNNAINELINNHLK